MNWKKILIGGIAIALIATIVACFGGVQINLGALAQMVPVMLLLILIVLLVNTWYQVDILNQLKELNRREDDRQ